MARIVELPRRGKLIVGTDLQGNLEDFVRLETIFRSAAKQKDGATLVITGDLVHGPDIPESEWPPVLGSYYRDASDLLIVRAMKLKADYPDRVFYLLGNHEFAHIGGPMASKFFPDEAKRLEDIMGPALSLAFKDWLLTFPWFAYAPKARILTMHAAPCADAEELIDVWLRGAMTLELDMVAKTTLARMLWARETTIERSLKFLKSIDRDLRVAVHGHDVVKSGYQVRNNASMCLSTSFGCERQDKLYLEWDLATPASDANHVANTGLRKLYDD